MKRNFKFPFIQAAGIIDMADAETVVNSGFNYMGFPLRLDFHKEDLSDLQAKEIIFEYKDKIDSILITYLNTAIEIKELCDFLGVNIVQAHGDIEVEECEKLKEMSSDMLLIKSIVISDEPAEQVLNYAKKYERFADAFLTDTFDSSTGAKGATGLTHDWRTSEYLAKKISKPLILAGGLNPQNVQDAIKSVKPFGVDSHTGIESANGRKDALKCATFVNNALETFKSILK